ncbi:MAG: biopolymer transporter ExbB [Verrucomicrobiales bacterium]|nr:biopolymer transporter ExbB [Verrucomicrobiales bacterium]|tara:strand:+ start:960 stop:1814 length:855 start_codon:yes stop_codon:yes gene_type:complete
MEWFLILAAQPAASKPTLRFVWEEASSVGVGIIIVLVLLSMCAWAVMAYKALQMRKARHLNGYFENEFRVQSGVTAMFDRRIQAEGCPFFNVYSDGCHALEERLKGPDGKRRKRLSLKSMEHIKGMVEASVAREAVALEGGLILLAIAVSGAPFIGLFGTVWGVMEVFSAAAQAGNATLVTVAPGVAAALATTVAGLVVAIPSMFGYNWLVHNLRVHNVELDNFAQEFASRMETDFLVDEPLPETPRSEASNTGEAKSHKKEEMEEEKKGDDEQQPELLGTGVG